jgi:AcrR family transcriptional regulator
MAAGGDRETALRAWLRQLTESVAENPAAAGLALVAAYDGGPAMLAEVGQGIAELERQLLAIRPALPVPLAQAIAAGIERVLRTWLLAGRQAELPRVADDLTDWVLNVVNVDTTRQLKSRPDPSESSRLLDHVGRGDPSLAVFEAIGGERGRILAATARLGASDGYRSLTAPRIRRQAGVSRRNFELLFDGVASCYLEAIEVLMHAAVARAARRPTTAGDWASRIERLTRRFCAEVSGSPLLARLGFTGVLEPGGEGLRCRENLLTSAASWLRAEAPQPLRPAPLAVEASLAASWRVVQADLMTGFNSRRDATILAHLLLAPPLVKRQAERVK